MTPELKAAMAAELARSGGGSLKAQSAALTGHYKAGGRSDQHIDFNAYLTVRLPATYAAVARVFAELRAVRPDFAPDSLLDAGSGPGTAGWAAAEAWPELASVTMVDSNRDFLAQAGRLARMSPHPGLAAANLQVGGIAQISANGRAALVVAAYALAEIPADHIRQAADALWSAAADTLVMVEPGTPTGFARLRLARDHLLLAGAVPVAPCPHGASCPMVGGDWCHFSVRLPRSRAHMHAKGAKVPFEDERFAYLVVSRTGAVSGGSRILSPPVEAKPGITYKLCTEHGLEMRHVARRDAAAYKQARKRGWGDRL